MKTIPIRITRDGRERWARVSLPYLNRLLEKAADLLHAQGFIEAHDGLFYSPHTVAEIELHYCADRLAKRLRGSKGKSLVISYKTPKFVDIHAA
jgi:hypothetical protein